MMAGTPQPTSRPPGTRAAGALEAVAIGLLAFGAVSV